MILLFAIVAIFFYFNNKLEYQNDKKEKAEPTFKRILYMDNITHTVIKWQFDLSAIPNTGDFVRFDNIEDKYVVKSIDYQICNSDIVIMCELIVKRHY